MLRICTTARSAAWVAVMVLLPAGWGVGCATGDGGSSPIPSSGGSSQGDAGPDDASIEAEGSAGSSGFGGAGGIGGSAGTGGQGIPTTGVQCAACDTDSDCQAGKLCVLDPTGRRFCASDCTAFDCDDAYECVSLDAYEKLGGDSGTAGAPGTSDAGNTSSPEAGPSDGGPADASSPGSGSHKGRKACVPPDNKPCPCNKSTEGFERLCFSTNGQGTCSGKEKCTSGKWVGCDAPVPARETCDGKDNNCDGLTDEQDTSLSGNDLCSDTSTAPPHSVWVCQQAKCILGPCEDGWTAFPDSLPSSAGCACHVDQADTGKSNDSCAKSVNLGSIADDGKGTITVVGTISSATDQDWFIFHGRDGNTRPSFNHYRVHIAFTSDGNPNNEFRLDVYRSKDPTKVCSAAKPGKAITRYDWCADSVTDSSKPADDDQSAYYGFRVYRAPGVPPTCMRYKIQITNYGTGACPKPDTCGY